VENRKRIKFLVEILFNYWSKDEAKEISSFATINYSPYYSHMFYRKEKLVEFIELLNEDEFIKAIQYEYSQKKS